MLQITVLMDNRLTGRKDLLSEHGLSLYVDCDGKHLLFDCGSSEKMLYNAKKMGIDLDGLDGVVLSHGHYDHAGGFRFLAEVHPVRRLYTGPDFFQPKYSLSENCYKTLSSGFDRKFLQKNGIDHSPVDGVMELYPGVFAVSGFPRVNPAETIPERFLRLTEKGIVPDDFEDEICLALETKYGLVVLVGCAHPGIVNMISHVRSVLGKPVHGVLGGIHLVQADEERIRMTAEALCSMGVSFLGLNHCTGERAEAVLGASRILKLCHPGPGDCVFFDR